MVSFNEKESCAKKRRISSKHARAVKIEDKASLEVCEAWLRIGHKMPLIVSLHPVGVKETMIMRFLPRSFLL